MPSSFPSLRRRTLCLSLLPLLLGGCALSPVYERPATPAPAAFKEAQGWVAATPSDALDRGTWWTLFNDPVLNELESAVEVSNQNIAAATAAYAQARALVQQQRAALFPVVSLDAGATRSGSGGTSSAPSNARTTSSRSGNNVQVSIGASWEPDVWGRLRGAANSASASAQASAADLASAKLSAQGELAANYFSLRLADAQGALLRDTIAGYERALQIARNRYAAGVATKTDVLQAETQLANAQADEAGVTRQRAALEHAIAVLLGKAPADFALAPAAWSAVVPQVPTGVPSTLLQRRPDIAAAERRVAAANEQIGIARAAYFPNVGLNASYGSAGSRVADLFSASTTVWSLGLSAAQTLFNAGATGARVAGAQAAQEEAAARYRQTVLVAFQDVENQLSAAQVLARQQDLRRQASQAADEAERLMLNRYRAGQVSYSEVVSAQATALNSRRALVQAQADRQTAAIALIQALGGGWHAEP
ncbi:MAG TPA: efflux transporter outer membrane subunit [Noviherbaspirillum sp.]|nr:efflux transporter outer membrane subunit [Noviherbaspirillum sp.]